MRYTFGTGEAAARRMETVAAFFNPHSAGFVARYAHDGVRTALDLGCGPGLSTAMLAQALPGARVTGVDRSPDYIARAQASFPSLAFIEADVARDPLSETAQLVYLRFLLSHLPQPVALANRWLAQLDAGGLLLLDELDAIDTDVEVFRRYLQHMTGMVAAEGGELFVGPLLGQGRYAGDVLANERERLPVPAVTAAGWFLANSRAAWPHSAFIRQSVTPAEQTAVDAGLAAIAGGIEVVPDPVWWLRRLALRCG